MWVQSKYSTDAKKWEVIAPNEVFAVTMGLMSPTLDHEYFIRGERGAFYIVPKVDYIECGGPTKWVRHEFCGSRDVIWTDHYRLELPAGYEFRFLIGERFQIVKKAGPVESSIVRAIGTGNEYVLIGSLNNADTDKAFWFATRPNEGVYTLPRKDYVRDRPVEQYKKVEDSQIVISIDKRWLTLVWPRDVQWHLPEGFRFVQDAEGYQIEKKVNE